MALQQLGEIVTQEWKWGYIACVPFDNPLERVKQLRDEIEAIRSSLWLQT
jgi:hypothetical protein